MWRLFNSSSASRSHRSGNPFEETVAFFYNYEKPSQGALNLLTLDLEASGLDAESWAKDVYVTWTKDPQNQRCVAINQSQKMCLSILYDMVDGWKQRDVATNSSVPPERMNSILSVCLPLERAEALYMRAAGRPWYSSLHSDESTSFARDYPEKFKEWQQVLLAHDKDPSFSQPPTMDPRLFQLLFSDTLGLQKYESLRKWSMPADSVPWLPVHEDQRNQELYYLALKEGFTDPKQVRVMLCGPYGVGKSSVARSLLNLPFDPNLESTQGIDLAGRVDCHKIGSALSFQTAVQKWRKKSGVTVAEKTVPSFETVTLSDEVPEYWDEVAEVVEADEEEDKNYDPEVALPPESDTSGKLENSNEVNLFKVNGITMMLWDFAGQIAYHSMHQMFFRANCLYLLVLNLQEEMLSERIGSDAEMLHDVQLWLNAIASSAGPEVGLLIVGTHADCFRTNQEAESRLQGLLDHLKEDASDIEWDQLVRHANTVVVDNKNGHGLDELRECLSGASKVILGRMEKVPLRWLRLLEVLEDTALPLNQFCLPLEKIIEFASKLGFSQREDVRAALAFFDQVGHLIYVQEDGLENWVFPEPHRLLCVIKSILAPSVTQKQPKELSSSQWEIYMQSGVLSNDSLRSLWDSFDNRDQLRLVLAQSGMLMDMGSFVVIPTLLSEKLPDLRSVQKGQTILEFRTQTECRSHLPPALFPFLLAGMHQAVGTEDQDLELLCRNCSLLLLDPAKSTCECPPAVQCCYVILVADQLYHTINMTLHFVCLDEITHLSQDMKSVIVEICSNSIKVLHRLAKTRFSWMALRTMVQTSSLGCGTKHKWCMLETNKIGGSKELVLRCPRFCIEKRKLHTLHDCIHEIKQDCVSKAKEMTLNPVRPNFDTYIAHAGEQKLCVALPLHQQLSENSLAPFIDHENLPTGRHAPDIMEHAMNTAQVGVFILSPQFIAKEWPMKELTCFLERYEEAKVRGRTPPLLIPVFHELTWDDCGRDVNDFVEKFNKDEMNSLSNPQFKFWKRVGARETSPEFVCEALHKLKKFSGILNLHGDAQVVMDTSKAVREHLAK